MNQVAVHTDFLRALIANSRDPCLLLDQDLVITLSNQAAAALSGVQQDDLTSIPLDALIPEGIPENGFPQTEPGSFRGLFQSRDQNKIPLRICSYPVREGNSTLIILKRLQSGEEENPFALLEEERIKTDALLKAIPDAIFIQDFKGNFLDYYPAMYEGFIPEDRPVKNRHISEFLPRDVVALFEEACLKIRNEAIPQNVEFSVKGNPERFYEAQLVPMNDHRILTILRDVSEWIRNEHALQEGENRLRNYLNSAASMFVVLRPNYKIALVNQKVCEILGYPQEKLLDQNWLTFLGSPKERKRLKLLFDRTLKGKSKLTDSFETYVLSQKGEKRLIRWQNALLQDARGRNTGLICSGEDISAQKKAEMELVRSEARNRAILEAIPDVILLHDQKGQILSVQDSDPTPGFFDPKKLVGKPVTEAFPGRTGQQMLVKIRESCTKQQTTILEMTTDGEEGRQFFEIRYACMENQQVLAVARDITRTKNTQQILNLRNRALQAAGNGILKCSVAEV